ncbi:MAG: hypothetical protein WCO51_11000, partial [bacterium]
MLRIKVLVTVVLGVVVLLMLIIIPVIDPFRKHFEQDIARNDMETLRSIILQYAEDHGGLIPAFDTASPPDWYKE